MTAYSRLVARFIPILVLLFVIFILTRENSALQSRLSRFERASSAESFFARELDSQFFLIDTGVTADREAVLGSISRRLEQLSKDFYDTYPGFSLYKARYWMYRYAFSQAQRELKKAAGMDTLDYHSTACKVEAWRYLLHGAYYASELNLEPFRAYKRKLLASKDISTLVQAEPVAELLFVDGWIDVGKGSFVEADEKFDIYLSIRERDYLVALARAYCHIRTRNVERAKQMLASLKFNTAAEALMSGMVYELAGDYNAALGLYRRHAQAGGSRLLRFRMANAMLMAGDAKGANDLCETLLQEEREQNFVLLLARIHAKEEPKKALELLSEVTAPALQEWKLVVKADAQRAAGDMSAYKDTIDVLRRLNPDNPELARLEKHVE